MTVQSHQICWDCKWATNPKGSKCSWAREFKPVKGWTAEPRVIAPSCEWDRRHHRIVPTYRIYDCPLFAEG